MKIKTVYIIFLFSIFIRLGDLNGQNCPDFELVFSSQSGLDNLFLQYPNCTELNVDLTLLSGASNPNDIRNLEVLIQLKRINGNLTINSNRNLLSLSGLDSLKSVHDLDIRNNSRLITLGEFTNLEEVNGSLSLDNNQQLESLQGLNNIKNIKRDLLLRNNLKIKNLEGLEKVNFIGNEFLIFQNADFESFEGLNDSEPILGLESLIISRNYSLTSLQSLQQFELRGISRIIIEDNSDLATCAIQSLCDYLAECKNKLRLNNNNSKECNETVKLRSNCAADSDISFQSNCISHIYPNPVSNILNVSFKYEQVGNIEYEVIDTQNRFLMKGNEPNGAIDVSQLMAGIYCLRIKTEEHSRLFRFVKN